MPSLIASPDMSVNLDGFLTPTRPTINVKLHTNIFSFQIAIEMYMWDIKSI